MNHLLKLTLFSLLSGVVAFNSLAAQDHGGHATTTAQPSASENTQQTIISTKGEVKLIDLENQKVTIAHEPIPAINWPAMTMRFTFEDPSMINHVQIGNQVELDFVQQGNISLLKKISITQ